MTRIGVIGYGYWGPNLARNIADIPNAELAGVSDARDNRLAAAARRYPGIITCADVNALLSSPEVDAVAIATPVESHFELAMQALECGKHVLVEKPMTQTAEQGHALVREARRRGRVLMVDHTFVYTGAVRKMKELINSGELGDIYYYDSARINLGLFQHDVDVIWDLAVHDFSILEYLLGRQAQSVSAHGVAHVAGSPANLAYVNLFYDGNTVAHVNVNWLAPVKLRRTLIGGSRKMVVYDDLEPSEKVKIYDKGVSVTDDPKEIHRMRIGYRAGDMWAPQLDRTEALRRELSHFVACIEDGEVPETGGESGLRVVELLEAASRSAASDGARVTIETLGSDAATLTEKRA